MPGVIKKPHIAFSVTNSICYDQRVLKIAGSVSKLGYTVTIIGRKLGDCCSPDEIPFRTHRFKMLFKKGFLFYKFFNIRLLFYLLINRYDLLVANDLDTLLPNFMVSKIKGIPLIYDSHEYFTGVPEIQNRPFVKWIWRTVEKNIFPHLKFVMTVSDSIADKYEAEYGIRPITVMNCSSSSEDITGYPKRELGVNPGNFLLIYQGAGINIDRGGEELIEAISRIENVSLLIVGSGDVLEILKKRVIELNLTERVIFIPKVPWHELIKYTKSADAGLSLDKDTNINYRFSLPNKLFDYISAGIPVIAGNLPEVKKIIEGNRCGIIIPEVTPDEICFAVKKMRDEKDLFNILKQNAFNASKTLTWDGEAEKVRKLYLEVLMNNFLV